MIRTRLARLAGLALLAVAVLLPASVASSKPKPRPPSAPSCAGFSAAAIANALRTGPLTFKSKVAYTCTWEGAPHGHYREIIAIGVVPGIKSIYQTAESDGMKAAAKQHKTFGKLGSRGAPWTAAFFVTGTTNPGTLMACKPDHIRPLSGPPACSGDPAWTATDVDAYNSKLMVSTAAGAELGDIHLSGMIELVREIASGKIR